MNNSIQDALNDLVAADAARLSGRVFADARGGGIARRVRTRRTVRAAGVGGASAVAVGAVAVGATQMPLGGAASPVGSWPGSCTPTPVADIASIWDDAAEPRAHMIDVSAEHDEVTWYLYDETLEMVVLEMVPTSAGVLVTFADGSVQRVESATWPLVFEAPGGGWVTYDPTDSEPMAMWQAKAPAEPSTVTAQDDVTPPFGWQWTGCAPGEPSASASVSPSPSSGPAITSEDVVGDSPFECGFEFPTESYGSDALRIDDAEWFTPEVVDYQHPGTGGGSVTWGSASRDALVPRVTVNHEIPQLPKGETASGVTGTGEPSLEMLSELRARASSGYNYSKGRTFVGVQDGKVVATGTFAGDDGTVLTAIFTAPESLMGPGHELMYLIDPGVALISCDANPVDLAQVDIVAVAGLLVENADGTSNPTVYSWLPMGKP